MSKIDDELAVDRRSSDPNRIFGWSRTAPSSSSPSLALFRGGAIRSASPLVDSLHTMNKNGSLLLFFYFFNALLKFFDKKTCSAHKIGGRQ